MSSKVPPVYLLSSERSGTNLLRRRLTEHQRVYYGPQAPQFLKHLFFQTAYYGDLTQDGNFSRMIGDALDLCYLHFAPWDIKFTVGQIQQLFDQRYRRRDAVLLAHLLMSEYAASKGYPSYFSKDNYLYEFYSFIAARLPEAKFIYLYRDPRDFTVSQLERPRSRAGVKQAATLWAYEQTRCIAAEAELGDRCLKLSYEQLISDEQNQLRRVCEFLGVEYFAQKEAPAETQIEQAHDWKNLNKPTNTENRGKYLRKLSAWQIRMIEAICHRQMQYLGYRLEYPLWPQAARWFAPLDQLLRVLRILRNELLGRRARDTGELMRQRGDLLRRQHVNYRTDR